jgi:hypothetical protein
MTFNQVETPVTPPLVIAEVGVNSYVDTDDCDTYMASRLGASAWDDASLADKNAALIMAWRAIDGLSLRGRKFTEDQVLEFPRLNWTTGGQTSVYSEEHERYSPMSKLAGYYGEEEVPQRVMDAQCEEALSLLASVSDTSSDRVLLQAQGVRSVRIGDFSETYAGTGTSPGRGGGRLRSIEAIALMRPYIAGTAAVR